MATSDLFYLIAVISGGVGTLCLGIIAWLSIRQTRSIQKAEKRERLLNEIIEWAIDIAKCETQGEFRLGSRKSMLIGLLLKYQAINSRSEYIKVTAAKFGKDFQVTINGTAEKLDEHLDILKKQIEGKTTAEECDKHWRSLLESTLTLTKKAAEIKAKDIG